MMMNLADPAIASWPPSKDGNLTRLYLSANREQIPPAKPGRDLPANQFINQIEGNREPNFHGALLESTQIISDLPNVFFETFLQIQNGKNPITLPQMRQDKNVTVREKFKVHADFKEGGRLHPDQWKTLGWRTKQEYEHWLDTSMLFAFSHCMHYCSAPRVFDADIEANQQNPTIFKFKQSLTNTNDIVKAKKTNILSVTGFEFRAFTGNNADQTLLEQVKIHAKITLKQILAAAIQTATTDIILIPYGMGVFLPPGQVGARIKEQMFQGMREALLEYNADINITIHCCGGPDFFDKLTIANPKITFENATGKDAYTLANHLQDSKPQCKSMLINAGDNDWTALLHPKKEPGQQAIYHDLYMETSDEYYALMTCFAYFSIQRMMMFYGPRFSEKISQIVSTDARVWRAADNVYFEFEANEQVPELVVANIKQFFYNMFSDNLGPIQGKQFRIAKSFDLNNKEQYNYIVSLSEDEPDQLLFQELVKRLHKHSIKNQVGDKLKVGHHRPAANNETVQAASGWGIVITPKHLHEMANANSGFHLLPPKLNLNQFKEEHHIKKIEFSKDGIRFTPTPGFAKNSIFLAEFPFKDFMKQAGDGSLFINYSDVRDLDIPGIKTLAQPNYQNLFLTLCIEAMTTKQGLADVIRADNLQPREALDFGYSSVGKSIVSLFSSKPKTARPERVELSTGNSPNKNFGPE